MGTVIRTNDGPGSGNGASTLRRLGSRLAGALLASHLAAFAAAPRLDTARPGDGRIELSWPADAGAYRLESTTTLGQPASWSLAPEAPTLEGLRLRVRIVPSGSDRYFRLRQATQALLAIERTSPAAGEGDISVTREAVFTFTAPVAVGSVVTPEQLHAEGLGRRLLGRVELAADRRQVSLFTLEPMPGGARVRVTLNGDALQDEAGRAPDFDGDGQPGGSAVLQFETASTTALPRTAVIGRVLASEPGLGGVDVPLPGVTITVDGQEQNLRTVTGADGAFRLEPCPAGQFYVNVDGRTSSAGNWPSGAYYPVIGKAWEAVAGKTNNLAGGTGLIYLPRVAAGTLQPVSATEETRVTFPDSVIQNLPELAGVEILVPPNGLYGDDGTRGGLVGLAPVASDRLPEPLPAGLDHALDISIQTSGPQNFDRPVPAKFPNLPDPITGVKLPPGAKSALWSFNHDTGRWEMQGPMTVTADGQYLVTDPGVGIRQPGWHGASPGSGGGGGPGGGGGGCPGGGGGLLAEGTSGGGSDCDCPDEPSDSKKKLQECYARAAACALKCYEDCGEPGRPEGWLDVLGKGKDCAEAAKCSLDCKKECERCKDHWQRCFLGGGGLRSLRVRLHEVAAFENDPAIRESLRLLDDIQVRSELWIALGAILDRAPSYTQLSPADQAEARAIAEQLFDLHENQWPAEYYAERQRRLAALLMRSPFADAIYPPVKGYYAIEDLETGLVRRGRTELRGYLEGIVFRPNATYRIRLLLGPTLIYHDTMFTSASAGIPTRIPYGEPRALPDVDLDSDGIPADAEFVLGTSDAKADSDNDGVNDLQELINLTDPLDGQTPYTGIVAGLNTPGVAKDVAIEGGFAFVADGPAGLAVVDVSDPLRPSLVRQLDTPGDALAVAVEGARAAVADGPSGLRLYGVLDPANAVLLAEVPLPAPARAVALEGGSAYGGLADGTVVRVEVETGTVLASRSLPGAPQVSDLVVQLPYVYVWAAAQLHVLRVEGAGLLWERSINTSAPFATIEPVRRRLRASPGFLYGTHLSGVATFDLTVPGQPALVIRHDTAQTAWKDLVPVQRDLGVAADGVQFTAAEPQDLSLYSLGPEGTNLTFLAGFPTPGQSHAVTLASGLAFLADGEAGLQVVQFYQPDTFGVPPTVELEADFLLEPPQLESGQPGRVIAVARDDVRVREVEFYLNGELQSRDRAWPFEWTLVGPPRTPESLSFTVRARAIDSAGNAAWSPELVVALLEDRTPPRVASVSPLPDSVPDDVTAVLARFNEPLDPLSVTPGRVLLTSAGSDLEFGTPDDRGVAGVAGYVGDGFAARLEFAAPLPPGRYRFQVAGVLDLAGNVLVTPSVSQFWVAPGGPAGDADGDALTNAEESEARTNPFAEDTDGDGWADEVEVHDGTDPRDPVSKPRMVTRAFPPLAQVLEDPAEVLPVNLGTIVSRPPVNLGLGPAEETATPGPWVARPPVSTWVFPIEETQSPGPFVARPPVLTTIAPVDEQAPARPIVGRPPVTTRILGP